MQSKEVDDSDDFHFVKDFSHPQFRIKINSIQLKETVEENKKTNDQVLQDRQYQVYHPSNLMSSPMMRIVSFTSFVFLCKEQPLVSFHAVTVIVLPVITQSSVTQ